MHTRTAAIAAVLGVALLVAGCSGGEAAVEESPSPAVEKDATYSTIADFREAVEEAGYSCSAWSEREQSSFAAAAADCDSSTVLSIFTSEAQRDEQAATLKALAIGDQGRPLLIGPNWMINGKVEMLEQVQPALGGIVDTSMP
ncbi:hypothetical protein [Oerskovia turbata]